MSEKARKIKIVIGEGAPNGRIIDVESGQALAHVVGVSVRMNESTGFKALATVEFFNIDVDIEANVEEEVTKSYRRLKVYE